VKKTHDLLALRSDAYRITDDWTVAVDTPTGVPPLIELEKKRYKLVSALETLVSLKRLLDESPWLQVTSECQRFGPPPRLNK
jgi:hypothetical protein